MNTISIVRKVGLAVAVAGLTLAGISAAQANKDNNPFGPKIPYVPPTKKPASGQDRPFSTPRAPVKYRSVGHYLLGSWDGSLRNGRRLRLQFKRDGKFAIVSRDQKVAYIGYYRVVRTQVQLVVVGKCNAQGCIALPQKRRLNFAVTPRNRNAMQALGGFFQRAA